MLLFIYILFCYVVRNICGKSFYSSPRKFLKKSKVTPKYFAVLCFHCVFLGGETAQILRKGSGGGQFDFFDDDERTNRNKLKKEVVKVHIMYFF